MAILVTKATNPTNTYTLGSTDTDNTIYGSNVAETFTFNGTGNLSIADVAGTDVLNLTNVSPVAGVTIAVTGNNVILTSGGKTYTLAALSNGESITVNLGSDKQSIVITATDTTDANNVTTTNYAYELNGSATPVEFTTASAIVFDTASTIPVISLVAADDIVNSAEKTAGVVISGTAETGATVTITWGGITQTATATGGNWTTTFSAGNVPADGSTTISVISTDLAGNVSSTATKTVVVDTVSPITTAPVVLAITSAALTNDVTPVVSGTAETGTIITAVIAGATYTTTATSGTWSVDTTPTTGTAVTSGTLAIATNGTNSISVTATDTAGNTSSAVNQTLTVDTTAPTLAITSNVPAVKIGETATITFTFDEIPVGFSAVDIITTGGTLTGLAVNPADSKIYTATFTPTVGTASGVASITVASGTYTDTATNAGGAGTTPTIAIDTLEPSAPTLAEVTSKTADGYLNVTEATSTTFKVTLPTTGSVAVAGDKVDVLSNGVSIKNVTLVDADITAGFVDVPILSTELGSDGSKSLTAKITDVAGNVGAASSALAFILDATAPTAPTTVTLSLVGGNVIANLLNNTNSSLEAQATITAGEVTGGSAVLKINGTTVATDASIAPNDTTVSFSVSDAATITTGGTATVEITDLAGNITVSSVANPTLTVNRTASTLTASAPAISVDNGSSTTDLKTNRAVQTITSTLGRALTNEVLYGSTNNGVTWTDITSKVSTAVLSWDGAVLAVGSNNISLKVKDSVTGNETIVNTAGYILDTVAPAHAPTFALSTDSGISNSDGISTTGTITVTAPTNGFETNARWDYSLDSGQIWSSVQATGVTSFTLPIGSYAIGAVQVRHIDEAGNASVSSTNAAAIVIDQTSPTASVTTAVVKNGGADKVVVQSTEKGIAYLVKSTLTQPTTYAEITTLETNNDTSVNHVAITTAATNTDLLTTSLVDGTYKVYTVDEAGNLSAVSTNSIVVDSTAPVVTITGASFVQKNLTTENTIRLTGSGFASLLTTGKEVTGSDINDSRFDWTKFSWVVTGATAQAITSSDIAEIKVTSATELDIVLKSTNALYSNANFLTGSDAVVDKLTISAGFFKDAAGNAATETLITNATVDTTTLYTAELANGTNAPTIYVPNIELTAPTTKANGVDYDNATFDGTNLKATPTSVITVTGIQAGQTITLNHLQKMSYVDLQNTINLSVLAANTTTESVVLNLIDTKGIGINNNSNVQTDMTLNGGGSYVYLGTGVDVINLVDSSPNASPVGSLSIDSIENFESSVDKVYLSKAIFTAFASDVIGNMTANSKIATGTTAPAGTPSSQNIWINDDGTISYDADGDWSAGSVALISILTTAGSAITASDLYLV
jgi:hypothetical protein